MAESRFQNTLQGLSKTLLGWSNDSIVTNVKPANNSYNYGDKDIILRTTSKEEYDNTRKELTQSIGLATQWRKANIQVSNANLQALGQVDLMYRDCELMDSRPEIGQALDNFQESVCDPFENGNLLRIHSKSERITSVLEDLFFNRLQVAITLPSIARTMCKYGNDFNLLNINLKNGILGWKQIPTCEVKRFDNQYPYGQGGMMTSQVDDKNLAPHFEWQNTAGINFIQDWNMAHFRLMTNSFYRPYGCSVMHSARRHFRLLSLQEDQMLIYMLDKAMDRRVFNVEVGQIDPKDVTALIGEMANSIKRTSVVDPQTGQLDLRKNILDSTSDIFGPMRDGKKTLEIDSLQGQSNLQQLVDVLELLEKQMLCGLRVPKSFLDFGDKSQGKEKTLQMLDIRFAKVVYRVQQAIIMELNKIAIIHLYLMGFQDDLNNFTITMHNPSSQSEILRIEEITKRVAVSKEQIQPNDGSMPLMSWRYAMKSLMKLSDKEIQEMLEDMRLEKALANELAFTPAIIQRTGIYDKVDKMYGAPNQEYPKNITDGADGSLGGGGGGGGGMPMGDDMGGDMGGGLGEGDFEQGDEGGDIEGDTGSEDLGEGFNKKPTGNYLFENFDRYIEKFSNKSTAVEKPKPIQANFINEEYKSFCEQIDAFVSSTAAEASEEETEE